MSKGARHVWVLFGLSCLLSVLLVLLVLLSPWFDPGAEVAGQPSNGWPGRFLALFARDAVVRRISLAGAIGLAVTGFVFFRPGRPEREPSRPSRQPPPPRPMAGA